MFNLLTPKGGKFLKNCGTVLVMEHITAEDNLVLLTDLIN